MQLSSRHFFPVYQSFFKHALGSGFLLTNIQRNFIAKPYKAIPGTPILQAFPGFYIFTVFVSGYSIPA
jgi:hypothetical protein